jgi:lysozyme
MRPRLSVSRSAVELIKAFEGFRAKAARLDDGRWTIGYGHTLTAREGAEITEADAEALLLYDLIQASHAVNEHVFAPLTQNQFDALVSFVFNIGVRAFRGSPTLRRLNEGRPLDAAMTMELWRKSDLDGERIVVDALVRRRAAEKALFLRPTEGWHPAPTALLVPKIDYDAVGLIPLTSPVATRTAMSGDRVTTERVPDAPPILAPEEPTASQAAAQAVIERLEALINEPPLPPAEPEAAPAVPEPQAKPAETEAPAATAENTSPKASSALPPITFMGVKSRRSFTRALLLSALGVIGIGLITLAAVWGFQPESEQVMGVSPHDAGLAIGFIGVVCFSIAAYFMLERLGRPSDRGLS